MVGNELEKLIIKIVDGDVVKMTIDRNTDDASTDDFRCSVFKNGTLVGFADTTSSHIPTPIDTSGGLCGITASLIEQIELGVPSAADFTNAVSQFT